jgi:excisionase family DNA binding protein
VTMNTERTQATPPPVVGQPEESAKNTLQPGLQLIGVEEVAKKLGVPVSWVKEHCRPRTPKQKQIPHVKLGRYVRFNPAVVDAWMLKQSGGRVM